MWPTNTKANIRRRWIILLRFSAITNNTLFCAVSLFIIDFYYFLSLAQCSIKFMQHNNSWLASLAIGPFWNGRHYAIYINKDLTTASSTWNILIISISTEIAWHIVLFLTLPEIDRNFNQTNVIISSLMQSHFCCSWIPTRVWLKWPI